MTRQDFDKYLDELTSETGFDLTKEQKAFAYQAAKKYHEQVLLIHDVSNRREQYINSRKPIEQILSDAIKESYDKIKDNLEPPL